MKKKSIVIGVAALLLCSSAYVLSQQHTNHTAVSTQETQSMEGTSTTQPDYNAIANSIKAEKEPVVVGEVFKDGYLKKHGNHYHFVKGTPPKDAIYEKINRAMQEDDGYVFNPKDIVEENEWGYVVKHGDHYHFVYKKKRNTLMHKRNQSHSGLTNLSTNPSTSNQTLSPLEKRIAEIMKQYGLKRHQIIVNEKEGTIIYPHGNHYHYERIGGVTPSYDDHDHDHDDHNHDTNQSDDTTPKQDDNTQLSKELEARIAEIMEKYGLKREQIKVDTANNAIIYPHGSHYHYEKIDPTKPLTNYNRHGIKEEKDDGLAHTETNKIVGPLVVTREQLLDKEAIAKAYPNLPIKSMAHYHVVGFLAYPNSRQKVGDLKHNGQLTDGVVYLVLKNTPWKEVAQTITPPETQAKEGYYFKSWTYDIPTEDIVDYPRVFGAQFRLEKYKNSPVVLGPSTTQQIQGSENVDLHDYVPVAYHSLSGGEFVVNGVATKHAFYLIKQGTTWKEAFANGFTPPQTKADTLFEFSEFSTDVSKHLEEKVSSEFIWTKFGSTLPVVGAYKPSDSNNPLSKTDPNRPHPKDPSLPYDEKKYVTLSFVAGENGYLDTFFEQTQVLTYVVRRGLTWKDIKGDLPQVVAKTGYRLKGNVLLNENEKIENDKIYRFEFEKINEPVQNNAVNAATPIQTDDNRAEETTDQQTDNSVEGATEQEENNNVESATMSKDDSRVEETIPQQSGNRVEDTTIR